MNFAVLVHLVSVHDFTQFWPGDSLRHGLSYDTEINAASISLIPGEWLENCPKIALLREIRKNRSNRIS